MEAGGGGATTEAMDDWSSLEFRGDLTSICRYVERQGTLL